tara:strand:+ start:920 stop:1381 length:462 start_codon:yes stop_codon:yes gene_type:complete
MENVVAVQIPPKTLAELKTKVDDIVKTLSPLLITLTAQQRKEAPKMGDGTEVFVGKVLDYTKSSPAFLPPYVKADDLEIDFKAVKDLNTLFKPLQQLMANLDDTILMSGSEAYVAALSYYNSVKLAARMNAPGAKVIYDDLSSRFRQTSSKSA